MANKYLEKIASLIKGKRLVGKITSKTEGGAKIKFMAKGKHDWEANNRLIALHETVERQAGKGAVVKHRLNMSDGSTGFIRGTAKGVRSRLYRE